MEKQLNVWIDENLKEALSERAQREKKTLKELIEDILRQETARYNGEQIEQQALPLLRDIMQHIIHSEMYKGMAHLEAELHDYLDAEFSSQKEKIQRNNNKLSSLLIRSVREGGINRHLNYTQLEQAYGPEFAQQAYDHALRQTNQEIPTRPPIRKPAETETEVV